MDKLGNYIIANELFHIMFRNYVNRFFKEKFTEPDKKLAKIISALVLLTHPKLKSCFSINFSFDKFSKIENRQLAEKIWPIWKSNYNSFKEFMIKTYKLANAEKTWISY